MKSRRRLITLFLTLLLLAMPAATVLAQDQDGPPPPPANASVQENYPGDQSNNPGAQAQDPPGRVARLQYMSGEVSMQPGGVNDWVAASLNRPMTSSDRVWTDKNSRAELNTGNGFIRMNSETSLTLTQVTDNTVQLELDQGVLEITVRHLEPGEIYEVDTPNTAFTVMKSGVYRIDVRPSDDQTWVTVRSGYGEATGKGAAVRVNSGMQVRFTGKDSLQHTAYSAPARDGFEDWAQVRDKRLDDSLSARYVSPGVVGYQDLDTYGYWRTVPVYGAIWTPYSVAAGWAPYRYGHWVWIAPWGWTWVDDAPWGFAPAHYGRWVYWGGAWAWAPGPLGYWNPYYAPALVGWVGWGGFGVGFGYVGAGWGIGIGFGWYPLGWGVPYYPHYCGWWHGGWYHGGGWVSHNYFRNVNVTNTHITNVNGAANNYYHGNFAATHDANRFVSGAMTGAPKSAFQSGAAINKVGTVVSRADANRAQVMRTADVNPTRSSVLGGQGARTTGIPSSAAAHNVVTRMTAPSHESPFGGSQSALARTGGTSAGINNHVPSQTANARTTDEGARGMNANAEQGSHGVPHPSGGNNEIARANAPSNPASHSVPRPPERNDAFARGSESSANSHGVAGSSSYTAGNSGARSAASNSVPRPPADYHYQPYRSPATSGNQSAPSHQAAPSQHAAPQGRSTEGKSSGTSRSSYSVPRPPAGYSYHAAPSYSASSSYAASRVGNSYSGNSRGFYGSNPYSGSSRSSYPSSSYYGSSRSYGSSPTYASRSYGSPGGYSAPHYSAPHYSGGGYHSSGGSYHSSGGGGSHGGGGGHGR